MSEKKPSFSVPETPPQDDEHRRSLAKTVEDYLNRGKDPSDNPGHYSVDPSQVLGTVKDSTGVDTHVRLAGKRGKMKVDLPIDKGQLRPQRVQERLKPQE